METRRVSICLQKDSVRWYLTDMRTRVSSKGQLVLPSELRQRDKILPGQQFVVERVAEGEYLLKRLPAEGGKVLDWLRSCPESGWFEALPSESTDTV